MSDLNHEHERWSEELAAYLLGALEPAEAAAFEHHAEGCKRCRAETRWLAPAMQALPETVERVEPPRELRERVMAEVREDAAAAERAVDGTAGESEAARGAGWRQRLAALLRGSGERSLPLRPLAGFAALALVVAAVAGYAIGTGGSSEQGGEASTVVSGKPPGVVAKMVSDGDGGTLHLANVEELPPGKVLEAWVQRDGTVTPVRALFVPDRKGRATTTIADMSGVETVMVTTEPRGGSDEPTSPPIVTMPIPG